MRVAFFLDSIAGRVFCTGSLRQEPTAQRPCALIVAPFAEEMNKSRNVLAGLCAALAEAGHDVLMPDLYGTGDSEGDFNDATLAIWRADLDAAIARMAPYDSLDLIGLRMGAMLAADAATRHAVRSLTLLHPQTDGRAQLNQMLRLRLAGKLMNSGGKEMASELKQRLAAGESLEIAGYRLSGQLAQDLESLALSDMPPLGVERVNWIEFSPEAGRPLMTESRRIVEGWAAQGISVSTSLVVCDQFWATQELAPCSALVPTTLQALAAR